MEQARKKDLDPEKTYLFLKNLPVSAPHWRQALGIGYCKQAVIFAPGEPSGKPTWYKKWFRKYSPFWTAEMTQRIADEMEK